MKFVVLIKQRITKTNKDTKMKNRIKPERKKAFFNVLKATRFNINQQGENTMRLIQKAQNQKRFSVIKTTNINQLEKHS